MLRSNVSDSDLDELYSNADFAILPFAYGAGSKLKLFEACSHGVTVLATRAAVAGVDVPESVRVADSPDQWREAVLAGPGPLDPEISIEYARQNSWPVLADKYLSIIAEAPLVEI
mgnify:CR=1 FL=1